MSEKGKVWVIDPATKKRQKVSGRSIQKEFGQPGRQQTDPPRQQSQQAKPSVSQPRDEGTYVPRPGTSAQERLYRNLSYHRDTAPFLLLAYLLGPFALCVTREGRKNVFWLSAGIGSGIAAAILFPLWRTISSQLEAGGASNILLIVFAGLVLLMAVTAWARAVLLIGRHRAIIVPNLPAWLKQSWMTGVLGLVVPGLGLFIAGRVRRAASVLWMVGIAALSAFVLSNAALLWEGGGGTAAVVGNTLEYVFIALGAIVVLGALTWIVQALDGARLAGSRSRYNSRAQGNMIAVALLAAIIVFSVMFEPASIGKAVDRLAVARHREGYRVIPLIMARTAIRLDPSQPEYVMHAATFYESLGERHTAHAMREELVERWEPCVSMAKQQRPGNRIGAHSALGRNASLPGHLKEKIEREWVSTWERIKAFYGSSAITDDQASEPAAAEEDAAEQPAE